CVPIARVGRDVRPGRVARRAAARTRHAGHGEPAPVPHRPGDPDGVVRVGRLELRGRDAGLDRHLVLHLPGSADAPDGVRDARRRDGADRRAGAGRGGAGAEEERQRRLNPIRTEATMVRLHDSMALLVAGLLLTGCGGGGGGGEMAGGESAGAPAAAAIDPTTVGTIAGRIAFEGTPPAGSPIDMSEEPTCAEKHPNGASTEEGVVDQNGGLGNVFVYIKEGLGGGPYPPAEGSPVLDQDGCVYSPHVIGLRTGQSLTIRNSDGLLHNINAKPTTNRTFNISQPTTMETTRSFPLAE